MSISMSAGIWQTTNQALTGHRRTRIRRSRLANLDWPAWLRLNRGSVEGPRARLAVGFACALEQESQYIDQRRILIADLIIQRYEQRNQ